MWAIRAVFNVCGVLFKYPIKRTDWDKFIQWNIFYPAMMFFIWLSVLTSSKLGEAVKAGSAGLSSLDGAAKFAVLGQEGIQLIIQVFVQVALMFGGLWISQRLGISGASYAMGLARGATGWIAGRAGRVAGAPVRATGAAATPLAKGGARVLANALNSPALRWIPGAKGAIPTLNALGSRKGETEDYQKKYLSGLNKAQWESVANSSLPLGDVAKSALLAEAVKRNDVKSLTEGLGEDAKQKKLSSLVTASSTSDPTLAKEIIKANPEYAVLLGQEKTIADAVKKIRADKAPDIDRASLLSIEVAMALSDAQISAIYRSGSTTQRDNLARTLREAADINESTQKIMEENEKKIKELLGLIKEAKERGDDKQNLRALQARLGGLRTIQRGFAPADAEKRKAYEKLQILEQRVGNKQNQ